MDNWVEIFVVPSFYVGLIAVLIVSTGCYLVISLRKYSQSPLNISILEIMGLCFILPIVLLISTNNDVPMEAVFGFLGTLAGYVFGKTAK